MASGVLYGVEVKDAPQREIRFVTFGDGEAYRGIESIKWVTSRYAFKKPESICRQIVDDLQDADRDVEGLEVVGREVQKGQLQWAQRVEWRPGQRRRRRMQRNSSSNTVAAPFNLREPMGCMKDISFSTT